ncbi:MAG: hypothetical protein GY699_04850 [Desulfobacteraceae bacterium]|nr:hypothetical protein [Desulfobacteraceae bacterium]
MKYPDISRYIHLNPIRIKKHFAKSIKTKIRILMEFVYSSFTGYLNPDNPSPLELGNGSGIVGSVDFK